MPAEARRYLLHVEARVSIRDIARSAGCHASTVMRQIRRIEALRDDILIDAALARLAQTFNATDRLAKTGDGRGDIQKRGVSAMTIPNKIQHVQIDATTLNREALRVLRRLCETGAVLAVAENMEKSVVVRDDDNGASLRTAVVDTPVAEAMALKEWIACAKPGRISRYHITAAGRAALSRLLAEQENRQRTAKETGFAESQADFGDPRGDWQGQGQENAPRKRVRYSVGESPLVALARRKDKDGQAFLSDSLVQAGERLREDFELAQVGPRLGQNWDRFLTGGVRPSDCANDPPLDRGPAAARNRVVRALADLGPGLSDVALRCCCYLEGLEVAEQKMGWSARSGKIVLRIALQRLKRHYETQSDRDRMIG
ncbi:MAG: helix-turn-helix domain-containing protein [Pseudooceanicola sp.]|nr:helix-turn-helix domain-containing protein [Pseudooceanicola sp.]